MHVPYMRSCSSMCDSSQRDLTRAMASWKQSGLRWYDSMVSVAATSRSEGHESASAYVYF